MTFLLDTNVLSELRRRAPSERVLDWVSKRDRETLFVSVVTLAEIVRGALAAPDAGKRRDIAEWLEVHIRPLFGERALPIDEHVALNALTMIDRGKAKGHTFATVDLLIGATSLAHGMTLVTRDVRHYAPMGVRLLDPWST